MLDNLLFITKLYVKSFACEYVYQSRKFRPNWGDIMTNHKDYVYFGKRGKWVIARPTDFEIWTINSDTGYFIYADYWDILLDCERYIECGVELFIFRHHKYMGQILNGLGNFLVVREGSKLSARILSIKCLKVVAQTAISVYGIICSITFIMKKMVDSYNVTDSEIQRMHKLINNQPFLKIQNDAAIRFTWKIHEYNESKRFSYDKTETSILVYLN